jgi:hypothetical protein
MENKDWFLKSANLLKSELVKNNIGYGELIQKLKALGVEETYSGISNKINRGKYSMAFFLQCMEAINVDQIRL